MNLDFLNNHKVGVGTAITVFFGLLWGAYEAGSRGWEGLNAKFVDHVEAAEHITRTDWTVMDKKKNVRIMEGKILDYEVQKVYAESENKPAVVAQIKENILRIRQTIKFEEEAIACLEAGNDNCDI